jgi:hypothetical protein
VKFGEPGEELGTVADGQLGQFFKDLSFAHGVNLARTGFSRKRDVSGEIMSILQADTFTIMAEVH